MKILISLIIITLMCPIQLMAEDLPILKPVLTKKIVTGSILKVEFSQFYTMKGTNRVDWFVTLTNTSKKNFPRNRYEIRSYQIDQLGKKVIASPAFIMN